MNETDFSIVPYMQIDGVPTFKDSEVMALYDQIVAEQSAYWTFYGGGIKSREGFLRVFKTGKSLLWVGVNNEDRRALGICTVDGIRKGSIYAHFCLFKETWGKTSIMLGKAAVKMLLDMPSVHVIHGNIPEENELAVKYTEKIGGIRLGRVPNGAWNGWEKKAVPSIRFYFVKEGKGNEGI